MNIEQHPVNDGVVRLAVTGGIDLTTADDLYDAITAAVTAAVTVAHAADVVIDLADVIFCDSAGIEAIMRVRRDAAVHGTDVQVINLRGVVRRTVDPTGVLEALTLPPRDIPLTPDTPGDRRHAYRAPRDDDHATVFRT